ncbi:iron-sulfur cluster assembly scaffold protein [Phototrophicus methaneseepsis]|uniref:Iron-sulfur cluster assembly scaffold protein n=1 Tax=Phototrophicus methaneseepsis TaxID=2710758 RepID=A0A7S8E680_9CHLR|nr:iron-sulfur cluster assembly scaffold protein [Phototrophicus methaneseepsis]QPC81095.1 iron-sulfur cluster assembly scaffold protein [Phototrophicus methaneseepsis]
MHDIYRELILDHAQYRRNWGLLDPNDFDHEEHNPLCGDHLHLTMRVDDEGIIREVGWDGSGCAISQASASMLGERLVGMPLAEARKINKQDILDEIGIPLTINRVKCALLSLKVLIVGSLGQGEWERIEDEEDD